MKITTKSSKNSSVIGQRFGRWTVKNSLGERDKWGNIMVWAVCDCDKDTLHLVRLASLRDGNSTGCSECKSSERRKKESQNGDSYLYVRYQAAVRKHRARFGKSGEVISFERYKQLLEMPCLWCNQTANGVDRLNNDEGYSFENSVPCCEHHNKMKGNKSLDDFLGLLIEEKNEEKERAERKQKSKLNRKNSLLLMNKNMYRM